METVSIHHNINVGTLDSDIYTNTDKHDAESVLPSPERAQFSKWQFYY